MSEGQRRLGQNGPGPSGCGPRAGLRINDTPRTIRGSKQYIWPLERFRTGWLRQLGVE
jgi:hypothetical protein